MLPRSPITIPYYSCIQQLFAVCSSCLSDVLVVKLGAKWCASSVSSHSSILPLIISEFADRLQANASKQWRSWWSCHVLQLAKSPCKGLLTKWSEVKGHHMSLHIAGNRRSHARACLWGHPSQKRNLVSNLRSATRMYPAGRREGLKEVCLHASASTGKNFAELQAVL